MKVERWLTTITYQTILFRKKEIKKFSTFLEICYATHRKERMR